MVQEILGDLLAAYEPALRSAAAFVAGVVAVTVGGRLLVLPAVDRLLSARDVERTLRGGIRRAVRGTLALVAVAVGTAAAGFGQVVAGSAVVVAALTVAVGFAAQGVVASIASGAFIVADPAFSVGDWIEWDGNAGVIDDISFRATRVRSFDGGVITVPNEVLTRTPVTNAVLTLRRRVTPRVAVDYDADLATATACLAGAARDHDDVLAAPEPQVRVVDLADAAVVLEAQFWIRDPDHEGFVRIRSEYVRDALARLDAAGIDPATTTKHELSGAVGVETDVPGTGAGPVEGP